MTCLVKIQAVVNCERSLADASRDFDIQHEELLTARSVPFSLPFCVWFIHCDTLRFDDLQEYGSDYVFVCQQCQRVTASRGAKEACPCRRYGRPYRGVHQYSLDIGRHDVHTERHTDINALIFSRRWRRHACRRQKLKLTNARLAQKSPQLPWRHRYRSPTRPLKTRIARLKTGHRLV